MILLILRKITVLLVKTFDTASGRCDSLLSGVERMAFRACFYVDLGSGGSGYKGIPAVAGNLGLVILRMDSLFHNLHLFLMVSNHQFIATIGY